MMPRRSFRLIRINDVFYVIIGTTISNVLWTRSNPFSHDTRKEVTTFELIDVPSVTDIEMTKLTILTNDAMIVMINILVKHL